MFAILTGIGLSASAGLNAYIPLLAIGLLGRYTQLIELPTGWHWLTNGWTLSILGVLLAIEVVADKIPAVDSVNDVLHTVIRPTAGGLAFGAASESQTVTSDPGTFFSSHQWLPVAAGVLIALTVHGTKAAARPVVNATTLGAGGPVVSTIEDIISALTSVVAIILPFLIILFIAAFGWFVIWVRRKRRERKARKAAARAARNAARYGPVSGPPVARPISAPPTAVDPWATHDGSTVEAPRRPRP